MIPLRTIVVTSSVGTRERGQELHAAYQVYVQVGIRHEALTKLVDPARDQVERLPTLPPVLTALAQVPGISIPPPLLRRPGAIAGAGDGARMTPAAGAIDSGTRHRGSPPHGSLAGGQRDYEQPRSGPVEGAHQDAEMEATAPRHPEPRRMVLPLLRWARKPG